MISSPTIYPRQLWIWRAACRMLHAGAAAKLVDEEEVHAKLEGAEVLLPEDPDGDLVDLL
jgi:hypothetical protein